jgi:hypothetical protein
VRAPGHDLDDLLELLGNDGAQGHDVGQVMAFEQHRRRS